MLGVRAHIEEKEVDVASTDEELSVAEDIAQEADEKELESEAVEVEMDTQALEEAGEILEEVAEADANADKALETPTEVTEDDVKAASASLESALFALQDKSFYKEQSMRMQVAYEDYGNNPAMRLQACQEGIKETIARIIEAIKNIFRRVIGWFKKQYAKFMAMIDRTAKKANKLKVDLNKKADSFNVPADEVGFLFTKAPFINKNNLSSYVTNLKDYLTYLQNEDLLKVSVNMTSELVKELSNRVPGLNDLDNILKNTKVKLSGLMKQHVLADLKTYRNYVKENNELTDSDIIVICTSAGIKCVTIADNKLQLKTFKWDYSEINDEWKDNKNDLTINKTDVKSFLELLSKAGNKLKTTVKDAFKLTEDSSKLVKSLETLYKKAEKENGAEMSEVTVVKAANIGRAMSTDVAVAYSLGVMKGLSDMLYTCSRLVASLEKKSKN